MRLCAFLVIFFLFALTGASARSQSVVGPSVLHEGFDIPLARKYVMPEGGCGHGLVEKPPHGLSDEEICRRFPHDTPPFPVECFYYPRFVIKVVGNDVPSVRILKNSDRGSQPMCTEASQPGETVFLSKEGEKFTAAFIGAIGDFVFLHTYGDFGKGRWMGIFDVQAPPNLFGGDFYGAVVEGGYRGGLKVISTEGALNVEHRSVYLSLCSLAHDEGGECWRRVKRETGLTDSDKPDCSGVGSTMVLLEYNALLTINNGRAEKTPLPGRTECYSVD